MRTRRGISLFLALAMVFTLITVMPISASAATLTTALAGVGYSGGASGSGGFVAVGGGSLSTSGNQYSAPRIDGTTYNAGAGLGSNRIGVLSFTISDAAALTENDIASATVKMYVNAVNGNIGGGWFKFALYRTANPTLTYALGGMSDTAYLALNDDYSQSAAMWSNEQVSSSNRGWKTVDVTSSIRAEVAANAALATPLDTITVVYRAQVPVAAFNYDSTGANAAVLEVTKATASVAITYKDPQGNTLADSYGAPAADGDVIDLTGSLAPAEITKDNILYKKATSNPTSYTLLPGANTIDLVYVPYYLTNIAEISGNIDAGIVYGDLVLPSTTEFEGSTYDVVWSSSDEATISGSGVYTRPLSDASITLTATVTVDGYSVTKDFVVAPDVFISNGVIYGADATVNFVTNSGFETDLTGWSTWTGSATELDAACRSSLQARSGDYSITTLTNGGGTTANANLFGQFQLNGGEAAESGKQYVISWWAYSPGASMTMTTGLSNTTAGANNQVTIACGGLGNSGSDVPSCNISGLPTNEWYKMSYVVTADGAVSAAEIYPRWIGGSTTFFDDISVYEVTPVTTSATVNYYNSADSSRLSGESVVALPSYTSGAATVVSDLNAGGTYSVTPISPIVLGGKTYVYDTTAENVTSVDPLAINGAGNVINLYYKEATILFAQWAGKTVKTRPGVIPTVPTLAQVEYWLETSDPETDPADGLADIINFDSDALAEVAAAEGSGTISGYIAGYTEAIEIPISVLANIYVPVAHYEFKDAAAPLRDTSGNGYDGTAIENNAAMSYDTDNGYAIFPGYPSSGTLGAAITIPGAVASKMSGDWSYSVWANRDFTGDSVTQGSNMVLMDVASGNYERYYYQLNVTSGNHVIRDRAAGGTDGTFVNTTFTKTPYPTKDKWSLITLTYNAETTTLTEYIDGEVELVNTNQIGSPASFASGTFYIGRNQWQNTDNPDFKGKMSDIRVYDFALSGDEVTELYQTSALSAEIFKAIYVDDVLDATLSAGYANVGDAYSYTPDATYTNATATYLYDAAAENITSLTTAATGNTLKLYYKTDFVTGAEAVSVQTREGILPALPETVTATTAGGSTVPNVPVVWNMPAASAITVAASPMTITGTINTGTEGGANVTISATVTITALSDYLLLEYDFDDETLSDTTGNYAATTAGALTYEDAPFGFGKALVLPGGEASGTNYASIPVEALAREDLGVVTVSAFVKPAVGATSYTMFTINSSSPVNTGSDAIFAVFRANAGAVCTHIKPATGWTGANYARGDNAISEGAWAHVVYVLDGTKAYTYVNGTLVASAEGMTIPTWANDYAFIGASGYTDALWSGSIDNIQIYSVALTADEVAGLDELPESKTFDMNYTYEGETIYSQSANEFIGGTYTADAGKFYSDGKIYTYDAVAEEITSDTATIDVPLTVETANAVASFTQTTGASIDWNGNTYIAAALGGSNAISTDADGNATYTGGLNFGSARVPTLTFNAITPTTGKAYILKVPVYMVDSNSSDSGNLRITAAYGDKKVVSLTSRSYANTRLNVKDPYTSFYDFDVTDAVTGGELSFMLYTPIGGVGFPTLDMAGFGGLWAGCAPYIEEVDGVTLTGGAEVTKLTLAGNEVTSGAIVASGYGAKAYFETEFTDYTADVFVNSSKVATLDETAAKSYDLGTLSEATTVYFTVAEPVLGVTVSGSFTADANADAAVVTLVPAEGATLTAEVTAADAENRSATYTFTNVAAGTYTLTIAKNAYVTYTKEVTVGAEAVTLDAVTLIGGDLDNSGAVNSSDLSELLAKYGASTTTEGWADFAQYDIDGSGSINSSDLSSLLGSYGKSY